MASPRGISAESRSAKRHPASPIAARLRNPAAFAPPYPRRALARWDLCRIKISVTAPYLSPPPRRRALARWDLCRITISLTGPGLHHPRRSRVRAALRRRAPQPRRPVGSLPNQDQRSGNPRPPTRGAAPATGQPLRRRDPNGVRPVGSLPNQDQRNGIPASSLAARLPQPGSLAPPRPQWRRPVGSLPNQDQRSGIPASPTRGAAPATGQPLRRRDPNRVAPWDLCRIKISVAASRPPQLAARLPQPGSLCAAATPIASPRGIFLPNQDQRNDNPASPLAARLPQPGSLCAAVPPTCPPPVGSLPNRDQPNGTRHLSLPPPRRALAQRDLCRIKLSLAAPGLHHPRRGSASGQPCAAATQRRSPGGSLPNQRSA